MKREAWPRSRISWGRNMSVFISEPFSSQPHPETAGNGEDDE